MKRRRNKKDIRGQSMRNVMLLSMWFLILSLVVIFGIVTAVTQFTPTLNDVAYRALYNTATGNVPKLSSELTTLTRCARQSAQELTQNYQTYLQNSGVSSIKDIIGNSEAIDDLLEPAYAVIQELLGDIAATGAFVMLDTSYTSEEHLASVYVRDLTPGIGRGTDNDLMLLRGSTRLTGGMRMALEASWTYEQLRSEMTEPFFQKPQEAMVKYPKADVDDWGYWSKPFFLSQNDVQVITFTTPLIGPDNQPIGVFGVELSMRYMTQIMPREGLPFQNGFFLIGQLDENYINVDTAFSARTEGTKFLMDYDRESLPLEPVGDTHDYTVYVAQQPAVYIAAAPLEIYGSNTPYGSEQYYLFTIAPKEQVLETAYRITRNLVIAVVIAMLVATFAAFFLSQYFAQKIERLAVEVRNVNPERPVALSPTNINEIDALLHVIEQMSGEISHYAARMSTIVDLVGIQMGAFEVLVRKRKVYLTESLFHLLRIPHTDEDSHYIAESAFRELLPNLSLPEEEETPEEKDIELSDGESGEERHYKVRMVRHDAEVYGTIVDNTEEIRERRWLEFERDFDPLTRLLNRNSYPKKMNALIKKAEYKMGVLIFGDLDNLKYINDTFGHDMGDRYIQMSADALKQFEHIGGVVARISGDEFAVYLHGYDNREEMRAVVNQQMQQVRMERMILPDGNEQKVRISIGLAYYPDDATDIETMIKYADFAMYEIKHSTKGLTGEFSRESYEKNSFILRKPNHLDRLIESRRLKFAFQPIVEVKTGKVHAYEALMRPQMREIHTPLEVIALAKSQSKLYQIEKLTVMCALEWVENNRTQLGDRMLFVNLIASQMLLDEDAAELRPHFPKKDNPLVMEITESEKSTEEMMARKLNFIRSVGCKIALDDYGTGYNGDASLLSIRPNYIKIDMSIVRGIDADENRQKLVRQVVDYAEGNRIRVIAEGVETREELKSVVELGVGYIQGYYVGQPKYELDQQIQSACDETAQMYRELHGE